MFLRLRQIIWYQVDWIHCERVVSPHPLFFSIPAKKLSVFHLKKEGIKICLFSYFFHVLVNYQFLNSQQAEFLWAARSLANSGMHINASAECVSMLETKQRLCVRSIKRQGGQVAEFRLVKATISDKRERPSTNGNDLHSSLLSLREKKPGSCWGSKLWFSSWNLQSFAMPFIWCSRSGADIAVLCRSWPAIPYRNGRRAVQRIHLYFFLQLHTYSIPFNPPIAFLAVKSVPFLRSAGLRPSRNRGRIRSEFIIYVIQVSPLFPPTHQS